MPLTLESLTGYIVENMNLPENELTPDMALFSEGILDSLDLVELIAFVEREIGKNVPPRDISLANFDSMSRIMRFTERITGS
jgi:acyl carrier protein